MPPQFRAAAAIRGVIEERFPRLKNTRWSIKSPRNDTYQCFAWAVCRTDLLWWPPEIYWPPANASIKDDTAAFAAALASLGYAPCGKNHDYEPGYQKVAIYASDDGAVRHMARQNLLGRGWLSKIGEWEDIAHPDLHCIEGDPSAIAIALGKSYGQVTLILKRTLWAALVNLCIFRCLWAATKFWLYRMRHPSLMWSNITRRYERNAV